MPVRSVDELELDGRRVLMRVDFNVPIDRKGSVSDDTRIRAALPTIEYIVDRASPLVLMSHLGRPRGKWNDDLSLKPVAARLGRLMKKRVRFPGEVIGKEVLQEVKSLSSGELLLLENLRFYPGEEKNDGKFAGRLSAYGDIFVNDAFGTAHRAHASNSAVAALFRERACGFLMKREMEYFDRAFKNPSRPLVAIFGGVKVSGKIQAIKNVMRKVDRILIGGAMANTFFVAMGYGVGNSIFEKEMVPVAERVLRASRRKKVKLYLPVDVVVAGELSERVPTIIRPAQDIPDGMMALDTGPATRLLFREAISDASTIVWNGPMGAFEVGPFSRGTYSLMNDIASSHALTIVGGGDTDTALHNAGLAGEMSYVSTGGGAFLELLEGKKLPGIEALK